MYYLGEFNFALLAATVAVSNPANAAAQQAQPSASPKVYLPQYFEQYAPRNAFSMVERIPGFSLDSGDQGERGLGQANQNVLINGQRISGKSNNAFSLLSRIDAGDVVRIEILDGAALDIPGLSGPVANVVYDANEISGSFSWNPQIRPRIHDTWFDAEVTINGGNSKTKWNVAIANNSFRNGNFGPELVTSPNGDILVRREELLTSYGDIPNVSGSFSKTASNGNILNLNGDVAYYTFEGTTKGAIKAPGEAPFNQLSQNGREEWNYEIGGDYSFDLAGGRMKFIGLRRYVHAPITSDFMVEGGLSRTFEQTTDESEWILRAEYGWEKGKGDWQLSLEGAHNRLRVTDARVTVFPVGEPETILELPTDDISEKRAELYASYGVPLTNRLNAQFNLGGEYSRIDAVNAVNGVREYWRPKGSIAMTWRANDKVTLNVELERIVDQLDFSDFITAIDVVDDIDRAGNAGIVPTQRWRARSEATVKLGALGTIKPFAQYEIIEDPLDSIPINDEEEAFGNLDTDAKRWSVGGNGTLLLDPLGVRGARLDFITTFGNSSIPDPLSGINRPLNGQLRARYSVAFRQDIPNSDFAWGATISNSKSESIFRLDQVASVSATRPSSTLYMEHKDIGGLKIRMTMFNLLGSTDQFERIAYQERRNGPIDFLEFREREYGLLWQFAVSGTF